MSTKRTRAELYVGELRRLDEESSAIYDRQQAVAPPPFELRGKAIAEITGKGELRIGQPTMLAREDVLELVAYLGHWFVQGATEVEVRREKEEVGDGDGE